MLRKSKYLTPNDTRMEMNSRDDILVETKSGGSMRIWFVSVGVALSSFLFGYYISALNPCYKNDAKGSIFNQIALSTTQQELATSAMILGAWIGCTFAGGPADKYGLRTVLLLNNLFFIGGGVLIGLAQNAPMLYAGRLIAGLGVGIESTIVPVLLSEIAPTAIRGTITTLHQMTLVIGILAATLVGFGFVQYVEQGWRYVQFFAIVPSVLQLFFAAFLPESPKWLVRNKQVEKARTTLQQLRGPNANVDVELEQIESDLKDEGNTDVAVTWTDVFAVRRPMIVGCLLMTFQPFSGINAVFGYSTQIFGFAGVDDALLSALLAAGTNVFATVIAIFLIDRLGRKTLLLTGTSLMVVSEAVMGVVLLALNAHEKVQGYLAVVTTLLFVFGFAIGMGAACWTVMSEILPDRIRNKAFSVFVAISWINNLAITQFTLSWIELAGGVSKTVGNACSDCKDAFPAPSVYCKTFEACVDFDAGQKRGVAILFLVFGGISLIALLFIKSCVPETRGKNAEEIASLMGIQPKMDRGYRKSGEYTPPMDIVVNDKR